MDRNNKNKHPLKENYERFFEGKDTRLQESHEVPKIPIPRGHTGWEHINKIESLKQQINYHNLEIKPHLGSLQKWEAKEYITVHNNNIKELKAAAKYMRTHSELWEDVLAKYGFTVEKFLRRLGL